MSTNEQSNRRQFLVISIPVLGIVLEALIMPFQYLNEIAKYAWIPFVGSLIARLISWLMLRASLPVFLSTMWMATTHLVLFAPFSVVLTRIAVQRTHAVLPERPFAYQTAEWAYLLAEVALLIALAILVLVPLGLAQYGLATFNKLIEYLGGMLAVAGAIVFIFGFVRLTFVFPALAIGKYTSIPAAWRETAGNFESITAVILGCGAPFLILRQVMNIVVGYHPPGITTMFTATMEMLLITWVATANTMGPALAYKTLVLEERARQRSATQVAATT